MILDSHFFQQPDSIYFERNIALNEIASAKLVEDDEPGIWLAGPGILNLKAGVKFPLAIIWKTSNKINIGSTPRKHGHLVLSQENGDDVMLLKLIPNDKMPPPGKEPKPTSNPQNEKERFSAGHLWYDLDGKSFAGHPGKWIAFVIAGSTISNAHIFEVKEAGVVKDSTKSNPPRAVLSDVERSSFLKSPNHPSHPEVGVHFKLGKSADGNHQHLLFGSFAFPKSSKESDIIHVSAMISGPEYPEMFLLSVPVPLETTHIGNGIRIGYFTLDLEQYLRNLQLTHFKFPEGTFITFLYRAWFGKPVLLDPQLFN